jgi:hypothetical protein
VLGAEVEALEFREAHPRRGRHAVIVLRSIPVEKDISI